MKVIFQKKPMTVLGTQVKVGDRALDFKAVNLDLSDYNYSLSNKVKVISVVPSLDTPVCSLQTTKFNMTLEELEGVEILTVSMDLPFAQAKFAEEEDVKNLTLVSDYKYKDFGKTYCCLIDEIQILTRAVIVIDKENVIRYVEYLENLSNEPNYDAAIEAAKSYV